MSIKEQMQEFLMKKLQDDAPQVDISNQESSQNLMTLQSISNSSSSSADSYESSGPPEEGYDSLPQGEIYKLVNQLTVDLGRQIVEVLADIRDEMLEEEEEEEGEACDAQAPSFRGGQAAATQTGAAAGARARRRAGLQPDRLGEVLQNQIRLQQLRQLQELSELSARRQGAAAEAGRVTPRDIRRIVSETVARSLSQFGLSARPSSVAPPAGPPAAPQAPAARKRPAAGAKGTKKTKTVQKRPARGAPATPRPPARPAQQSSAMQTASALFSSITPAEQPEKQFSRAELAQISSIIEELPQPDALSRYVRVQTLSALQRENQPPTPQNQSIEQRLLLTNGQPSASAGPGPDAQRQPSGAPSQADGGSARAARQPITHRRVTSPEHAPEGERLRPAQPKQRQTPKKHQKTDESARTKMRWPISESVFTLKNKISILEQDKQVLQKDITMYKQSNIENSKHMSRQYRQLKQKYQETEQQLCRLKEQYQQQLNDAKHRNIELNKKLMKELSYLMEQTGGTAPVNRQNSAPQSPVSQRRLRSSGTRHNESTLPAEGNIVPPKQTASPERHKLRVVLPPDTDRLAFSRAQALDEKEVEISEVDVAEQQDIQHQHQMLRGQSVASTQESHHDQHLTPQLVVRNADAERPKTGDSLAADVPVQFAALKRLIDVKISTLINERSPNNEFQNSITRIINEGAQRLSQLQTQTEAQIGALSLDGESAAGLRRKAQERINTAINKLCQEIVEQIQLRSVGTARSNPQNNADGQDVSCRSMVSDLSQSIGSLLAVGCPVPQPIAGPQQAPESVNAVQNSPMQRGGGSAVGNSVKLPDTSFRQSTPVKQPDEAMGGSVTIRIPEIESESGRPATTGVQNINSAIYSMLAENSLGQQPGSEEIPEVQQQIGTVGVYSLMFVVLDGGDASDREVTAVNDQVKALVGQLEAVPAHFKPLPQPRKALDEALAITAAQGSTVWVLQQALLLLGFLNYGMDFVGANSHHFVRFARELSAEPENLQILLIQAVYSMGQSRSDSMKQVCYKTYITGVQRIGQLCQAHDPNNLRFILALNGIYLVVKDRQIHGREDILTSLAQLAHQILQFGCTQPNVQQLSLIACGIYLMVQLTDKVADAGLQNRLCNLAGQLIEQHKELRMLHGYKELFETRLSDGQTVRRLDE